MLSKTLCGEAAMSMKFERVARGLGFAEGPIAMADGSILYVDIRGGILGRVSAGGRLETVASLGGGPNGAALGPGNAVYICNNGGFTWHEHDGLLVPGGDMPPDYRGGSIQRVDLADGSVTTLYTQCDGRSLRGPNDLVFDAHGGFWFTDFGKSAEWSCDRGAIYYALADGSGIVCARSGLLGPNGIGLSPQQDTLYVSESYTGRLWAFDIVSPGVLAPAPAPWLSGRLISTLPGFNILDSLAVEASGRVCVAGGPVGGITIFDTDGNTELAAIPGEIIVTNICFGGEDLREAWITAAGSGSLYHARWPRPGLRLNF